MSGKAVLPVLREAAGAVAQALRGLDDWGPAGTRPGQYRCDLVADEAAVAVLQRAGVGVVSEESGAQDVDRDVVVVLDPVDGSTNAARGIPWFATSLCAVEGAEPVAALVVNLASGVEFSAVRSEGARRDGRPIGPSGCERLREAVVSVSGLPPRPLGWRQFRAFGAAALDLCAVAAGMVDAYVDCSRDAHGPWDYLGAFLVCREAGAVMCDADGRDLVTLDPAARRTPLAAATPALLAEAQVARARAM